MNVERETRERIVLAALELFLAYGIKKTTMDEVASQSGVTRVTVYRYFGGKKQLVHAAFMCIISAFQRAQADIYREHSQQVEGYLDRIGEELAALPKGDLPKRLDELRRLYPDIWNEFRETRRAAIKKIFERLYKVADGQGLLRKDLNREVVRAYFAEAVIKVMESPSLVSLNLSSAEIYSTVKTIFLHGVLKEQGK